MLIHCIKAENLKLKHSCIWLACLIIPCIPAVMGVFNYLQNLELLKSGWYSYGHSYRYSTPAFSMLR